MHLGAIILAAGLSTRMAECKALLSIGPRTFLGHAISLFRETGIADVIVVTGHQSEKLTREAERYPCRSIHNANYRAGMFSSIQAGVEALDASGAAFFLLPVDIPLVRPDTILELIEAMNRDRSSLVFYPEYRSRRGHPPLIRRELVAEILRYGDQGGLRALLKRFSRQSRDVSVDDPCILLDADTRQDWARLQQHYLQRSN